MSIGLSICRRGGGREMRTLSTMSPLDLLPTMSTSQPSKRSLSRRGLRYPLPVEDRYPQVIDAPRGRIRRGTFGASSRFAFGRHSAASKSIYLESSVGRETGTAAPVAVDDRRASVRFNTVKKSRDAIIDADSLHLSLLFHTATRFYTFTALQSFHV